jgi:hypothetical protein
MPTLRIISRTADEIVVRVSGVDRTRDRWEALDRIGRRANRMNDNIVATMPRGEGEEVEVVFFKPDNWFRMNGCVVDDEIGRQFELRSLVPDPYAQAAVNEADPAFADDHPNATCWEDKDYGWCAVKFDTEDRPAVRYVSVLTADCNWPDNLWWFAGIRKLKPVA